MYTLNCSPVEPGSSLCGTVIYIELTHTQVIFFHFWHQTLHDIRIMYSVAFYFWQCHLQITIYLYNPFVSLTLFGEVPITNLGSSPI